VIDHPDYAYKFRFFKRLRALFERNYTADDFVLWVGDMNVAPTEIDVTIPKPRKNMSASTRTYENSLKK
jgi:exodeoxyribonuclease-3